MKQVFTYLNITEFLNTIANIATVAAFIWGIFEFRALRKEQVEASKNSKLLIAKQEELLALKTSHLKFIYKPLFQFQSLELKSQVDNESHVQLFFINEGATAKKVSFVSPDNTIRILTLSIDNKNSVTVIKGKTIDVIGIIDLQIPAKKSIDVKIKLINGAIRIIPFTFDIQYEDEIGTKYSQTVNGNGFDSIKPRVMNPVEYL